MFAIQDIVIAAVIAGVLAGGGLAIWSWARRHARFVVVGITTIVGFIAWNLTLNVTSAKGFLVDAPIIPISLQDVGSGVLAFTVTALVLGLIVDRREPARDVVGAAAIAGLVAMIFDIFVL